MPNRRELRSAFATAKSRPRRALGVVAVAALIERPRSAAELAAHLATTPRALAAALRAPAIAALVERDAGGALYAAPGATSATLPYQQRLVLAGVQAPRARRRRRGDDAGGAAIGEPGVFLAIARATERLWRRAHLTYDQAIAVGKLVRERLELTKPAARRGAPPRLSPADANRLIAAAYRTASARGGDTRARGLLVKTLLLSGARVNEFVHLRAEDLDVEQARIRIRKGKGGKVRTVPILPELAHELRTHLGSRRAGWLFESRAAGRYSTRRVQQIVREVAGKAGIVHRVYPHLLRHTVAQHLLDRGMPIDQVRLFLGHEDIKTTQIYAEPGLGAVSESYRRALGGGLSASWTGGELAPALPSPRGAAGAARPRALRLVAELVGNGAGAWSELDDERAGDRGEDDGRQEQQAAEADARPGGRQREPANTQRKPLGGSWVLHRPVSA